MGCPKIIYYQVQEGLEKSAITVLRGLEPKKTTLKKGYSYYPFGLSFNSWQRESSLKNKLNTFQDQELIEDLDLGWVQFKWRNHMPEIGRFFNVDPLAEKYVYNSPYAFSENVVINAVELEGLEKVNFNIVKTHVPQVIEKTGILNGKTFQLPSESRELNVQEAKIYGEIKMSSNIDVSTGEVSELKVRDSSEGFGEDFLQFAMGLKDFDGNVTGRNASGLGLFSANIEGASIHMHTEYKDGILVLYLSAESGKSNTDDAIIISIGGATLTVLPAGRDSDTKNIVSWQIKASVDKEGYLQLDKEILSEQNEKDRSASTSIQD